MIKPKEQRRYIKREYPTPVIRELFKVPLNEMVIDLKWDRTRNIIVVETITDFDKNKGDV